MAYFKINGADFSAYVNSLNIKRIARYNAQTNAAGNTVVDYINHKRSIEVGIIPLDDEAMKTLQAAIAEVSMLIEYRDAKTGELTAGVKCILPSDNIEYYTIQANKVQYRAFKLTFEEL